MSIISVAFEAEIGCLAHSILFKFACLPLIFGIVLLFSLGFIGQIEAKSHSTSQQPKIQLPSFNSTFDILSTRSLPLGRVQDV